MKRRNASLSLLAGLGASTLHLVLMELKHRTGIQPALLMLLMLMMYYIAMSGLYGGLIRLTASHDASRSADVASPTRTGDESPK